MRLKAYEFMVLLHPADDDGMTEIIVDKTMVLGADEKTVGMLAVRSIDPKHDKHLDRVEIIVRPF